jgi:hypothetical protein
LCPNSMPSNSLMTRTTFEFSMRAFDQFRPLLARTFV